ncbi:AAA family ATPase [Allokutzneria sp. NRRL B-24872]|uniref:AAA family ATPase n=1 Tax=Allokutzneria sp. NRRL B-24872 TaxID=1137961 RepID=UPI000A37FF5A|nr:AAA family ATPase [Allokutzneria sp. NRRL B-24872]
MDANSTSVLWVTGAPGTGKSTTGWGLFRRIAEQGGSVAYVDIDQLGLIGPPPGGGDASHAIKAANLARVLDRLRQRGVRQVIVSGIVDTARGVELDDLTLVCLRCDREDLRRRFLGRGSPESLLDKLFELAEQFDRLPGQLDTTGQDSSETVSALLPHCVVAPGAVRPLTVPQAPPARVVVVSGATAVGKSTAAWGALQTLWDEGFPTAYIDTAQLGFVHPGPDPELAAAAVAALWEGYREAGAESLIIVTRELTPELRGVFGELTTIRLDAHAQTLAERVRRRARGESALLAGDELRGASVAVQDEVTARAVAEAEQRPGADVVLDTSGHTASETAAELVRLCCP